MNRTIPFFLITLFLIIPFILGSCDIGKPSGVLSEDKMEDVLLEYYKAKSISENSSYGSTSPKGALYIEYVFRKYGITRAEFDSSLMWYSHNSLRLAEIYDRVSKRLEQDRNFVDIKLESKDKKNRKTEDKDSVDIWSELKHIQMNGHRFNNIFTYSIPTDSNFKENDTLLWSIDYRFKKTKEEDSLRYATMALIVYYDTDTVNLVSKVFESKTEKIYAHSDSFGNIKNIKGFILYYAPDSLKDNQLFLDNIKMMRYRTIKRDSLVTIEKDSIMIKDSLSVN